MFAVLPAGYDPANIYSDDSYFSEGRDFGIADYDKLWDECLKHFYVPRLSQIRLFQEPARLLDIGCASGGFLEAAREQGWRISGVELSPAMRALAARRLGCPIYASLDEALASPDRFECVTIFEVIEHVDDPVEVIDKVAQLLVPNGLLALSTPNCESPQAAAGLPINIWFKPPAHICYFGPQTLPRLLAKAELQTVAIEGLVGYCRAMAGDTEWLPPHIAAVLRPFRRNKRLRPGGFLGKLLKAAYPPSAYHFSRRLDLYKRRKPSEVMRTDVLEVYARKRAV